MKRRNQFTHLNQKDRDRIHALYGHGHNQKDVARVLEVSESTISRELKRYGRKTWRYSASRAQEDANKQRKLSKRPGMKIAEDTVLRKYIICELKRLRSPDEIAGRMKREGVSPHCGKNAIYKWLYGEDGRAYCKYLCTKRSRKKKQDKLALRVLIPNRISLKQRPNEPNLVHAEGDLFVSPYNTNTKVCGLVVVEKSTKLLSGSLVEDKTTSSIVPAMQQALKMTRPNTCTLDNGIENIHHREFGVPTYFCDKGAPQQKPDVESSIGLIRRWFLPKGTNLSEVSDSQYQSQLHLLNHKYRKSLGYRSSYEVALERGIIKRVPRVSLTEAIAFR